MHVNGYKITVIRPLTYTATTRRALALLENGVGGSATARNRAEKKGAGTCAAQPLRILAGAEVPTASVAAGR